MRDSRQSFWTYIPILCTGFLQRILLQGLFGMHGACLHLQVVMLWPEAPVILCLSNELLQQGNRSRIPVPTKSVLLSLEETVSSCQWGIYAVSA